MTRAAVLVLCYLFGAVPFGLLIGKLTRGIDIRQFGSGNIGASNVLRTLGMGPALAVFFFDTAKGLAAVLLCHKLGLNQYWTVAGALLSVVGHTFSIFLNFQGGKGVATSLGVIIGLSPVIAAVAVGIWIVLVALTRYISVASMVASASVPVQMILWKSMKVPAAYQVLAGLAALGIILKHKSNLVRLANRTEPRIGQKVDTNGKGGDEADE